MAYDDWSSDFQEMYDYTPGVGEAYAERDFDTDRLEALFEAGFMLSSDEARAAGYSEDGIQAIRDAFFEELGIDETMFDWEEWRHAMGYD